MNMNKISVIIPAFNCEKYIKDAVNTVLNQTYKNYEIIVVDDGSEDNTKGILQQYIDKNSIKYIYQENQGPGAARNTGIKAAKGEYIAFLDADDVLLQRSLEARINIIEQYGNISFVFSDGYVENIKNNIIEIPFLKSKKILKKFSSSLIKKNENIYLFDSSCRDLAIKHNLVPLTSTVLVKKECFNKVELFDEKLRAGEDKKVWLALMGTYNVGFIDEPLSVYKAYRSTLTRDTVRYCLDSIKIFEEIVDKELNGNIRKAYGLRRRLSDICFRLGYYYLNNKSVKEAQKYFMKSLKYNPLILSNYYYVAISFLPQKVFNSLKCVKNKLF